MGEESPKPTTNTPTGAVFLSYASQDAEVAQRICEALRAAGIEVWFDKSELRGGEAWDASIRRQIKACRLFLPVISASTQAREEGYFRREWNLAAGRTLDRADDAAFLIPVVIDATSDAQARVPEKFREVQWTRLSRGETPASFIERVRALISGGAASAVSGPPAGTVSGPEVIVASPHHMQPPPPVAAQPPRTRGLTILKVALPALLLVAAALVLIPQWQKKEHARTVLLPEIENRVATMFRSHREIFDEAVEAERYLPGDPTLAKLWPLIATTASIETVPEGAEVFWKDYDAPGGSDAVQKREGAARFPAP
jgi:TIR domain